MTKQQKIKVCLKPDSFLAFIAARKLRVLSVAIVFGRTIHLHNVSAQKFLADKRWVLHELKHVEQYERLGFVKFIYTYLRESIKNGYYNNGLEIEARNAEQEDYLLEKYEVVDHCKTLH